MYAQLGNIIFEGLKGFTSFTENLSVAYAQHARIDGKPRLEATGSDLDTISFEMYLHYSFSNIEADTSALRTAHKNNEVLPLILGNGSVLGNFVIPTISKETITTNQNGDLIEARVTVDLLECYIDDPLSESKRQAQHRAIATSVRNSNVRTVLPPKLSEGMSVTADISHLQTSGAQVTGYGNAVSENPATTEYYSGKINGALDNIESTIESVNNKISDSIDFQSLAPGLPSSLGNVSTAVQNIKAILPISDIASFQNLNRALLQAIGGAKSASVGISNQSVIRRI